MTSAADTPFGSAHITDTPDACFPDRSDDARQLLTELAERLEARMIIDRAMHILMSHQRMTEPEAYRWIQKTAMDRRVPMALIATTIVEGFGQNAARAS